jgi:hypothetical protein
MRLVCRAGAMGAPAYTPELDLSATIRGDTKTGNVV